MKEFNSQVCTTKEQSQRLLELGLKPETADCMYFAMSKSYHGTDIPTRDRRYNLVLFFHDEIPIMNHEEYEYISAWSLHRLIELGGFNVECKGLFWRVTGTYFSESCDKIYDTIIDSIEALITENLFNKEYLE